jgi:hypothetical protein
MTVTTQASSNSPHRWAAMASAQTLRPTANPTNTSIGAATRSRCDSNAAGRYQVS